MEKSCFKITQMDCAAEETLVRMKLQAINTIASLDFNLSKRELIVFHTGHFNEINAALNELNLGSTLIHSEETFETPPEQTSQRRLLWLVLIIDFVFFIVEISTGIVSKSMGLIADSLDMLADALVYGLSLLAVGTTLARKKNVAKWSGYFQITLAVLGFTEVLRRFLGVEVLPNFKTMIVVSSLALIANGLCLYLLQRSNNQEAHMQASMIFSSNDVIINVGVIIAGILVNWLGSSIPDLLIGALVFVIVLFGAIRILNLAK